MDFESPRFLSGQGILCYKVYRAVGIWDYWGKKMSNHFNAGIYAVVEVLSMVLQRGDGHLSAHYSWHLERSRITLNGFWYLYKGSLVAFPKDSLPSNEQSPLYDQSPY